MGIIVRSAGSGAPADPSADIFTRNYATLGGNWTGDRAESQLNTFWTRSRIAGGGPSGRDCVEMAMRYDASATSTNSYGGQFNWGWDATHSDLTNGVSRFYRGCIRLSADSNFNGISWPAEDNGAATSWDNKFWFHGPDGDDRRAILNIEGNRSVDGGAGIGFYFRATPQSSAGSEFDYPADQPTSLLAVDTDYHWQLEIRYGTAGAGYMKLWVNNDTYASPSAQLTGITSDATGYTGNGWNRGEGSFCNQGLASNGVVKMRLSRYQVASTFASNWYATR